MLSFERAEAHKVQKKRKEKRDGPPHWAAFAGLYANAGVLSADMDQRAAAWPPLPSPPPPSLPYIYAPVLAISERG